MTKSAEFKIGDIVTLKSGGPEMTVNKNLKDYPNSDATNYRCQWFAGKKLESGDFPEDSLQLVKKEG